ncbi:MAG TPA: serine/threonine-protein kinase, partial [Polyangiaceae bacterium]|nr:serine/threonine-protein kinase [Polyangiaceae bacterium]
ARIVGALRSEHVTRVYELGQLENGVHYMAMEYLDGADLSALLAQHGRFHFTEAASIVRQACEAIAEAHQSGVVHRDLKPANLFSTRRPNGAQLVKVLDFGISKTSTGSAADHSMTRTSAIMGSPYYMSPEQLARPKTVDFRTDIWSLGVILHELVTGRVPFQGDTLPELTLNVHHDEPPSIATFSPDVPAAYQAIVTRCLQKDRELRYGSIRELSDALAACESVHSLSGLTETALGGEGSVSRTALEAAATHAALAAKAPQPGKTGNWGGTIPNGRRPRRVFAIVGSALGVAALGSTALVISLRGRGAQTEEPNAPSLAASASAVARAQHVVAQPLPSSSEAPDSPSRTAAPAPANAHAPEAPSTVASNNPIPLPLSGPSREAPPTRKPRAADPRPSASTSPKSSRGDGAQSGQHPAGWDDEILKP